MRKSDIKVGEHYFARVNGKITKVLVTEIREVEGSVGTGRTATRYFVNNISTGRKTVFRSAQKFQSPVKEVREPETTSKLKSLFNKDVVESTAPHMIVAALAGTGKTTTLVEGLKYLRGEPTSIIPSDQQKAVWDALALSPKDSTTCFVAFNKSIAVELQKRVPDGCDAMTMHSMGNRAIYARYGKVPLNEAKVQDIICDILGKTLDQIKKEKWEVLSNTTRLVSLCKMNLVGTDTGDHNGDWFDVAGFNQALDDIAAHHDIELNGTRTEVFDLVPKVLEACKDLDSHFEMDYNDMVWLPVALNLHLKKYDILLVDESQDLNRCQQELARKAGSRIVLCGDKHQAIYGFAGADSSSMRRMQYLLEATGRGCKVFPLTVTRRCSKAVVREAQRIVPSFEAHEDNLPGTINFYEYKAGNFRNKIVDGDMVICRVNAPLVSECFKLLGMGYRATIIGRDIGAGLTSLVNKLKANSIPDLVGKLEVWYQKMTAQEQAKKNPREPVLIAYADKRDCLMCFMEEASTVNDVLNKIQRVFTDADAPGVRLSSIHKAKGLEAKNVWLLQPEGATVPHPMAKSSWQREQEMNLLYVGISRSIDVLNHVN